MGTQFSAYDATRPRVAFDGRIVPTRLELDAEVSFHYEGAELLIAEVRALARLSSLEGLATIDRLDGELEIADALRVASALDARQERMEGATARRAGDLIDLIRAAHAAGATHVRWS